jgi:hypothetical protein
MERDVTHLLNIALAATLTILTLAMYGIMK